MTSPIGTAAKYLLSIITKPAHNNTMIFIDTKLKESEGIYSDKIIIKGLFILCLFALYWQLTAIARDSYSRRVMTHWDQLKFGM